MIIAFLTVGTMGLSNTSLGYLNYPTQVIFKCCKLIPVMIGGVFIQGKWQRRSVSEKMSAAAHRVLCSSLSKYWIVMIKRFFLYKWSLQGIKSCNICAKVYYFSNKCILSFNFYTLNVVYFCTTLLYCNSNIIFCLYCKILIVYYCALCSKAGCLN